MSRVWIDGRVCDEHDARVSPFDHGLLTGDGVFETLMVIGGQPFAARRHLQRLVRSCEAMLLPAPDCDRLRQAMDEVIAANNTTSGRLRVTVTGGVSPLGSDRGTDEPFVVMAVGARPAWPATSDVVVVPWVRNERGALAGVKSTSYGENVVALAYAKARGGAEAIFANTVGNLCEGTGSNVFLAVDGRLVTPPLASGCLAGVTRALLLEEVQGAVEADVPITALAEAGEAFLTSSTREVQPIRAVDGHVLSADAPGPLTRAAAEAFNALVARDLDP